MDEMKTDSNQQDHAVPNAGAKSIGYAVESTGNSPKIWSNLDAFDRSSYLHVFTEANRQHIDELAMLDSAVTGRPISEIGAHRVANQIRCGVMWINDRHKKEPHSIWGEFDASGYGKENGWDALTGYLRKHSIEVRTEPQFDDWFAGGKWNG